MATRYPLTLNTGSSTIEELPSGVNLDLSGSNISNVGNIAAGNSVTATYLVGNGNFITNVTSSPAGSNTQIQYNNAGTTAGSVNLTFNNSTNTLSITNITSTGTSTLGNIAITKYNENVIASSNTSTSISPNVATGTIFNYVANSNFTFNSLTSAVAGSGATVIITQDATGSRVLTSTMKFLGGSKTLSTAAAAVDIISVFYDGTTYYATLGKGFA
jgi:hypothetical protein